MSHIYSALIFQGHDLATEQLVFLDASFVWVMRDIDVFLPGPAADTGVAVVDAHSNGTIFQFQQLAVPPAGIWGQWRGRQVFQPIDAEATLVIRSDGTSGGVDVRISGWKLTPP